MAEFIDLTKNQMGFREAPPTCKTCIHHKEIECSHTDRLWYDTCIFSELCHFKVAPSSTCSKHCDIDPELGDRHQ